MVLSLIAELPAAQKEAVFLAYFADMTHEEIASWSGAPLGTIKGRIRMGMQKIRAGLEEQTTAADEALSLALGTAPEPAAEPALLRAGARVAPDEPATSVAELDPIRRRRAALAPVSARRSRPAA